MSSASVFVFTVNRFHFIVLLLSVPDSIFSGLWFHKPP
ncbi:hypothetical protein EVA_05140 [gut metagenome]|uniref:Uncharacterized protein n=1 Tax=gut metagenome TaxID=749906 RepID=J9H0D3_9ZZZZ